MLITIISDVHNNLTNLKKVLDYCREFKIEKIICCGDLASLETLDFLNDNFEGEIFFTFGNMDDDQLKDYLNILTFEHINKYKNTLIFKEFSKTEIEGKLIAFVHYPDKAKELARSGKYDFVFYGHTHKPWEETIDNCKILNPGNVAGEIYPPTFCIWDTNIDNFNLIRINSLN
jgi:hypothetical protein